MDLEVVHRLTVKGSECTRSVRSGVNRGAIDEARGEPIAELM